MSEETLSKNEQVKQDSRGLRGTVAQELLNPSSSFEKDTTLVLKFHGMYQQDNRDARVKSEDGPTAKTHSLMIRGRIPGGRLTAEQYLVWDELGSRFGNGSMRLTTRQSIQLHGILKKDIKLTIQKIHEALLSTTGACGDIVRNVTQAVNFHEDPQLEQLDAVAQLLSDHFRARSRSYAEVWLDEEQVIGAPDHEPIYGDRYLPRKFKIAVTAAGNNSVDLYTNDMAFAATYKDGQIDGYFVFAGGGLGRTHRNPKTFARLADNLGWIPASKLVAVAEAVVTIHRDFGDRKDRKHARLKYVIADRGIDWMRAEVQNRSGAKLEKRTLPEWKTPDYLGWHRGPGGKFTLGLHILAGRIHDTPAHPLKTVLRNVIRDFRLSTQITPDQDLILLGIAEKDKPEIERIFREKNIPLEPGRALYARALACPALPTCGLAIAESERYLPSMLNIIQEALEKHEMEHLAPVVRMTGCPNGCARPYSAELGFAGRSMNIYGVYLGGNPEGTRITREITDNLHTDQLPVFLDRLFSHWKKAAPQERLGDFASKLPLEELQALVPEVKKAEV
jgi:sulfite reductase beta subunit-like hemoprotein